MTSPKREPAAESAPEAHRRVTALPKPDGFRDTIESIIIALIFAFVFRAFVVEAFVIPTGSMAPTLYGLHAQHRCACCQYPFAYGLREPISIRGQMQPGTLDSPDPFAVRCPNCGWEGAGNNRLNSPAHPVTADAGDRILVLKWPYDVGGALLGPARWDVVVFKDPQDGDQNFIKRLLGLPGEVVELIDGDLYTAPIGSLSPDLKTALETPRPPGPGRTATLPPNLRAELDSKLHIQRKTDVAQQSLWLNHYDNDYPPSREFLAANPDFDPPLWKPEAGEDWQLAASRIDFHPSSDKLQWIRLTGKPIEDDYGYNNLFNVVPSQRGFGNVAVGDVRVEFLLVPLAGAGEVSLLMAKDSDEFIAVIRSDGQATLKKTVQGRMPSSDPPSIQLAGGTIPVFQPDVPVKISFENLDYRVTLCVNDKLILSTDDRLYSPDLRRLREQPEARRARTRVAIAGRQLPFEIQHLKVDRDVYYRSNVELEQQNITTGRVNYDYPGQAGWATANHPLLLRAEPGEYLCCGDNSPQSKDSRLWWEASPFLEARGDYHAGTVPADQMIGRAFFVYWPSGYHPLSTPYGFVPNVGRMRFIR